MRVAAIQMQVGVSKEQNLARALALIDEAAGKGARFVVLPECFTYMGPQERYPEMAETIPGPTYDLLAQKAREHGIIIHGGSLIEEMPPRPSAPSTAGGWTPDAAPIMPGDPGVPMPMPSAGMPMPGVPGRVPGQQPEFSTDLLPAHLGVDEGEPPRPRFFNSSFIVDPVGTRPEVYRKVHLFDVEVEGGISEKESAHILPGPGFVTAELPEFTVGLSICYDLRFPDVYRILANANATVMVVPSAFAEVTGRAHWEILLRARAIDNGAFVIAPAQHGTGGAWPMYGHSMIVGPWGEVLAELPQGDGVVIADIDASEAERRRAEIPVLANRRPGVYVRPPLKSRLDFAPGM